MRHSILCLPVVLSAVVFGGCAPKEEPAPGGGYPPPAGGSTSTGGSGTSGSTTTMGGNTSGGMGTGGATPTAGSGGSSTAGTGGDIGVSGSGGSGGGGVAGPEPTAGCGKDPGQQLGEYVSHMVAITGATLNEPDTTHTMREIFVRLPDNYDPNTPYRVVYITVGCGGSGTSGYPLWAPEQGGDPNAIYVGLARPNPPPEPPSLQDCYDNRGGVDSIEWESLQNDHAFVSDNYCVDNKRVYTGGYSSGGWMSNMYSCYFAGEDPNRMFMPNTAIRGAMAVAGCWIPENPPCSTYPVGGLWIHDEADTAPNAYSCAVSQRDRVLAQNGCADGPDGPTEEYAVPDGTCVKYTNCPAAYPVIFCTTQGRPHQADNDIAIPEFTKLVTAMEAAAP